ncbi:sugar-transfer associated ATP-grasp domain-containing protein [Phycisphaerales bacterium AB-hyl4]|uniref:Sugar-transfer associated ATP-grasp domain-containing protein n=1 Tax=Natronomicrosphaera hydrolytica TaxID=3242702 RepID=A0ABV4U7X0_9BACT
MRTLSRKMGYIGGTIGWPVIAMVRACAQIRQHGAGAKRLVGRPIWKQWLEQWWLALWLGLPPHVYYMYEIYRPERRRLATEFLRNQEVTPLAILVSGEETATAQQILRDKCRFAEHCKAHGLATAKTLAVFDQGEAVEGHIRSAAEMPATDLFAKPLDGNYGRGLHKWANVGPNRYRNAAGEDSTVDQVWQTLAACSQQRPYLLQESLVNHPSLRVFGDGALCTARIVTACTKDGDCVYVVGVFRMPRTSLVADNFQQGGLATVVDETSGRLSTAAGKDASIGRFTHHPVTGAPIEGAQLPDWEQAKALCLASHQTFGDIGWVGWDVAFTDRGPVLVEGNFAPSIESIQRASGAPFAGSNLYSICLERLERKGYKFSRDDAPVDVLPLTR